MVLDSRAVGKYEWLSANSKIYLNSKNDYVEENSLKKM